MRKKLINSERLDNNIVDINVNRGILMKEPKDPLPEMGSWGFYIPSVAKMRLQFPEIPLCNKDINIPRFETRAKTPNSPSSHKNNLRHLT